jgi:hypothetical protein
MKMSVPIQPSARVISTSQVSFIDKIMDFFARLPVPYWLIYLILVVLQSSLMHAFAWADGWLSPFRFSPVLLLFPLWQWGPFAIMTYLDSISVEALANFRSLLDISDEEMERVKSEFIAMPPRSVFLSAIFWGITYLLFNYLVRDTFYTAYHLNAFFSAAIFVEGLISYVTGSVIYYHSIRQLMLVHRTVKMAKKFNLFHLNPVYAFSRVTSQTGIAWMILLSLTLITFPIQLAEIPTLLLLFVMIGLAASAFVLPLWIVNHRLVVEKRRLLSELNQRMEKTLAMYHEALDNHVVDEYSALSDAIVGLSAEKELINSISTWPWRKGVLTGFLSATVLPIVLFLTQLLISKFMGQ